MWFLSCLSRSLRHSLSQTHYTSESAQDRGKLWTCEQQRGGVRENEKRTLWVVVCVSCCLSQTLFLKPHPERERERHMLSGKWSWVCVCACWCASLLWPQDLCVCVCVCMCASVCVCVQVCWCLHMRVHLHVRVQTINFDYLLLR